MSAPNPLPKLELFVSDLALERGGVPVLEGLGFALAAGGAVVLRGPNGAGKSSALLALGGHLEKKSGQIQWLGLEPEVPAQEHMHLVGHLTAVKPALSVIENLAFWCALYGGDPARVAPSLAAAGLGGLGALAAGVLSAGQTRRLALARLLVAPRPVWLLDEPSSALDAAGSAWVAGLIATHLDRGGMVIAATHLDLGIEGDPRVRTLAVGPTP